MGGSDVKKSTWAPADPKKFSFEFIGNGDFALTDKAGKEVFSAKASENGLECRLFTNSGEEPFTLNAPKANTYLFAYNGYYIQLFANKALADEEWPFGDIAAGELDLANTFAEYKAMDDFVSHVASDEPVIGDLPKNMQYFSPLGCNAGDCMPYFHDGTYHLYYLHDRRNHRSKRGYGAHQWAHVSTKDFKTWQAHPIALGITEENEGSICTGSVIEKDGKFYAFYANRDIAAKQEVLTYAVGDSPNKFTKTEKPLLLLPSPPYVKGPCRDPYVYLGADGLYHMLVTTRMEDHVTGCKGGTLAILKSKDLKDWTVSEPFQPGYSDDPECADYFEWNGWYYVIFSNEGVPKYRMSRHPEGPWLAPEIDTLEAPCCRVMRTAAFHGNRRIGAAFLERDFGRFGGHVIFREIIQNPDGSLGTAFVPELVHKATKSISVADITLNSREGFAAHKLEGLGQNFRLTADVWTDGRFVGLGARCDKTLADGWALQFDLVRGTAQVKKADMGYFRDNNKHTIFADRSEFRRFTLKLVVHDAIMDAEINGRRTICGRIDEKAGSLAFLYAHNANVTFENIQIDSL